MLSPNPLERRLQFSGVLLRHGIARVVWHLPKIKDRLKAVSSLHKDKFNVRAKS